MLPIIVIKNLVGDILLFIAPFISEFSRRYMCLFVVQDILNRNEQFSTNNLMQFPLYS